MNLQKALFSICLLTSGLVVSANSAQAASFVSNIDYTNSRSDIFLNSITQNGTTFNNFSFVNRSNILYNDPKTGEQNSGAASTDAGHEASFKDMTKEDPNNQDITQFLGNNNLNHIIDTEDKGNFQIDVFFDSEIVQDNSGLDSLFFWERGQNSKLEIQALNSDGDAIGLVKVIEETQREENYAGFKISTKEIKNNTQKVGSWGVSLDDLDVNSLNGVRLTSRGGEYNGPDYTLLARTGDIQSKKRKVPEPTTILGLGVVAGMAFLNRRKKVIN